MNIFEIYIAYVSWGSEGKRRPVLILEENTDNVMAFKISTHYENKSERIREKYFTIKDWKYAGLNEQSYIDTNNTVTLPLTSVDTKKQIGRLSEADERRLIEFID